jgi:hypothetical protein
MVDTDVVTGADTYIYTPKKVGNVSELPLIAVHFDTVFRGRETTAAFVRGVFQISEEFTTVKIGDRNGQMEVDSLSENGIVMANRNSIDLSSGSIVDLMGNIKFKVADSSTLRFYPFVEVSPEMIASQLLIDVPPKATSGDTINVIKVTNKELPVSGVTLTLDNVTFGNTDSNGELNYTPLVSGTHTIYATKSSLITGARDIDIKVPYSEFKGLDIGLNVYLILGIIIVVGAIIIYFLNTKGRPMAIK